MDVNRRIGIAKLVLALCIIIVLSSCRAEPSSVTPAAHTPGATMTAAIAPSTTTPFTPTEPQPTEVVNQPGQPVMTLCLATMDGAEPSPEQLGQVKAALDTVRDDPRFEPFTQPRFGVQAPNVMAGCPEGPAIRIQEASTSPYYFHVPAGESLDDWLAQRPVHYFIFIISEDEATSQFGDFFPRRASQDMFCQLDQCAEATSALYLTPAELQSQEAIVSSLSQMFGLAR